MRIIPTSTKVCIVIILLIAVAGYFLYDYIDESAYNRGYDACYDSMSDDTRLLETTNSGMQTQIEEYERILTTFLNYAVFVSEYGEKYHRYACHYIRNSDKVWIYNVENAQAKGYTQCSYCFGMSASEYLSEI